jgi:phage-related protein
MVRNTRSIGWVRAARKAFDAFPLNVQDEMADALTIAAEGGKADIAKPMKGLGSGVMEIALPFRGDAYRAVYVTEIAGSLWVVHAFQKKSKTGIKTSRHEIDLIRDRVRRLRQELSP